MAQSKYAGAKVGIFVSVAILLTIYTLFWAKGSWFGEPQRKLSVYFRKIDVLNPGDPLNVNGVKKGKVEKIELVADSVRIDFSLAESVKIKQDYKIEVAILALMGGNQLALSPGRSSSEIDYSQPMKGTEGGSIGGMISQFQSISDSVKTLLSKFGGSVEKVNIIMNDLHELTGDQGLKSNLRMTMSNVEMATRNLNALIAENRGSLKGITSKVNNTIGNVDSLITTNSGELNGTIRNIRSITEKVDSLVANLGLLVSDTQQQKNGIGKFIYDDKFFENINATVKELDALMKKIRKDGLKLNLF
ncbi:MAG: MCE family protein [Bacteroidetes bacterium]|nr:MCE family protein [Bacteroidota bacterium]